MEAWTVKAPVTRSYSRRLLDGITMGMLDQCQKRVDVPKVP